MWSYMYTCNKHILLRVFFFTYDAFIFFYLLYFDQSIFFLDLSTGLLLGLNKETYVAIGASVTLFILSVILMVVLMKYCQRKSKGNNDTV